jgi:antitoxin component YwqK of YwqJK toxin-antitoxin module
MKKHVLLITLTWLAFSVTGISQASVKDTLFNQTDVNGLKQGYWKKYYPNGKLMYKAFFKDNKPVGIMHRYFDNGNLQALMNFDKTGKTRAKLYFDNGKIAAEGNYINSKKDSIWKYYSYYTHAIVAVENYVKGIKEGLSKRYFENGGISEELEWKNDKKNGEWKQYFPSGTVQSTGSYKDDKLNGEYKVYYESGQLKAVGNYDNNMMNGKWVYYDEKGNIQVQLNYINGKPENAKKLTDDEQKFFEKIEQNKGKFNDPTPADVLPGGHRNNY